MIELPELNLADLLKRTEDIFITVAMSQAGGNIRKAAKLIGTSDRNMRRKISARKKLG